MLKDYNPDFGDEWKFNVIDADTDLGNYRRLELKSNGAWMRIQKEPVEYIGFFEDVGIGTTEPDAKLDVDGDVRVGGNLDMSGNDITNVGGTDCEPDEYLDGDGNCVEPEGGAKHRYAECGPSDGCRVMIGCGEGEIITNSRLVYSDDHDDVTPASKVWEEGEVAGGCMGDDDCWTSYAEAVGLVAICSPGEDLS